MSTYPRCGAVGPGGETCQIHADAQHDEHEWAGQVTVRKSWPNVAHEPTDSPEVAR